MADYLKLSQEAFEASSAYIDANWRSDWVYALKAFRSEHAPGGDGVGEVPWRAHEYDTVWREGASVTLGESLLDRVRAPAVVTGEVDGLRHFGIALGDGLARSAGHQGDGARTRPLHLVGDGGQPALSEAVASTQVLGMSYEALGLGVARQFGAKRVIPVVTHAVLCGDAYERLSAVGLDELVITDTIPLSKEAQGCRKVRVLSVAGLLAETILRITNEESVSSLFVE